MEQQCNGVNSYNHRSRHRPATRRSPRGWHSPASRRVESPRGLAHPPGRNSPRGLRPLSHRRSSSPPPRYMVGRSPRRIGGRPASPDALEVPKPYSFHWKPDEKHHLLTGGMGEVAEPHSASGETYDIQELLAFTHDIGVPVRKIDTILHRWNNQKMNVKVEDDIQAHVEHQYSMIVLLDGFEKEVFNDPRVYNGTTGPMTDMLRSCYFTLYNHLLQKGLEFKIGDYSILVSILLGVRYNEEEDQLDIPPTELDAIKQIISRFELMAPNWYGRIWWENFANNLIDAYKSLESWEFWINYPQKRSLGKIISNKMKGTRFPPRGIWEYHPSYIDYPFESWKVDLASNLKQINQLKSLFP